MSFILINDDVRYRPFSAFPEAFINRNLEFIAYPRRNSYFIIGNVDNEISLKAKVLEWLSRDACKGGNGFSQKYHLDGINAFLGTAFTKEQMMEIYTYLGNCCNHEKTLRFIGSGYDMEVLKYGKTE